MKKATRNKSLLALGILVALLIVWASDLLHARETLTKKKQKSIAVLPLGDVTEK